MKQISLALFFILLLTSCASNQHARASEAAIARTEKCVKYQIKPMVEGQKENSQFTWPRKLEGDTAEPPENNRFGIIREAEVCIQSTISAEGLVTDAIVAYSSNESWAETVVEALESWRFAPATLDGQPVEFKLMINLTYHRKGV